MNLTDALKFHNQKSMSEKEWIPFSTPPPDEEVYAKDENGVQTLIKPLYYDFVIGRKLVFPCEKYWDGSIMILENHPDSILLPKPVGKLTHWRHK